MRQEPGEPVDNFISRIKNLAAKCQFRDNIEVEDRGLDQLIWESRNPVVQKALVSLDKTPTLAAAVDIARSHEATNKHTRTVIEYSESYEEDKSINTIQRAQQREFCNFCGKQHSKHQRNKCPAYGTSCLKCGKANHWQYVCRSSKWEQIIQETKPTFKKTIHTIKDKSQEDDDEILTISTIEINAMEGVSPDTRNEAFAALEIFQPERKRKINLQCKVDIGA